jgi:PAS domain S-box-containing protein
VAKSKRISHGAASGLPKADDLSLLADLAAALPAAESPEALQQTVLEKVLDLLACRSGAVWLWEKEKRLRKGVALGRAKTLSPEGLLGAEPVLNVLLHERRPLALENPGLTLGDELAGWQGLAMAPLVAGDKSLGFLLVGDRRDERAFTPSHLAILELGANLLAFALDTRLAFAEFRSEMERRMAEATAELKRAGAELARLKTFNEDLFQSAPVGIIVFDRDFRVTFRNAAAERLWPQDRSVLAAARRTKLLRSDPDWETNLRGVVHMRHFWRAEDVSFEPTGREPVRVNLACSPLFSAKEAVVGGVLIVEDVTQRALMERRLAVSERLAGVGRLAAMVAHEINNPLDGIMRLVNLARRAEAENEDPRAEKYLAEADKGLLRLAAIVRDLLAFSQSATQVVEPMPIRDLLAEAAEAMQPAAEKAAVRIDVSCADDVPPVKSSTLYHVVLNLVKNAVEAMPDGGRVTVSARAEPQGLVVEVADTGSGIPPESLAKIFEPFYSHKAKGKGTGLGLVISKDLVEKQGGTLEAANRPEGGALFTVRVPLLAARPRDRR